MTLENGKDATLEADNAVLRSENARLCKEVEKRKKELTESLEYQSAISGVLQLISQSPPQLETVLDTIVTVAQRLSEGERAQIFIERNGQFHLAAHVNTSEQTVAHFRDNPYVPGRSTTTARALLEGRTIHVPDVNADPELDQSSFTAQVGGARLCVPLRSAGRTVGVISIPRGEARPFSQHQIELVTTFADQAVIAIENARLFEAEQTRSNELAESLSQQTASAEVLRIISSSPGELEPVFDKILACARQLCEAEFGHLLLFDGEFWRPAALHNLPQAYADFWNREPVRGGPGSLLEAIAVNGCPYQKPDAAAGAVYREGLPLAIATVDLGGARTLMGVPLLKDGVVVGAIVLYRKEVNPFSERQIALLGSFADQAVIRHGRS